MSEQSTRHLIKKFAEYPATRKSIPFLINSQRAKVHALSDKLRAEQNILRWMVDEFGKLEIEEQCPEVFRQPNVRVDYIGR